MCDNNWKMMMKNSVLALSLALLLPLSSNSFAQDVENTDASATVPRAENMDTQDETTEDHEESQQDHYEQSLAKMRPTILRLYPDYVQQDAEDRLFHEYLENYYDRLREVPRFEKAQQQMQVYVEDHQALDLRELSPKKSKLDALLYQELSDIYTRVDGIQQQIQFYLKFNQAILQQVDFDQPLPALSQKNHTQYRSELEKMQEVYKKQVQQLASLVIEIDQYQKTLETFQNIDSKKVYKQHIENITQLNTFALQTGHFLNAQIKAYDAFYMATRFYSTYQAKDNPQWAEKFKNYLNSSENQKRTQILIAAFPNVKIDSSQSLSTQLEALESKAYPCRELWQGQAPDEYMLERAEQNQQQFIASCQQTKSDIQQFMQQHVTLEALPYQAGTLPNLDFLGDLRVYGDDIYYTHSEKNALYRFDTKTLKEQLIYQYPLQHERDGCDHNMCRGVGAADVAISKDGKTAYVASLDYNQVFAINLSNNQVIEKYKVERYPRKLLLDESGENLFVYNGVANSISKITLKTGQIESKALPDAYQGHFCREIDLTFSPISGNIKILGDWPDDPYIYMNTQDMSFYHSTFEVPYPVIYRNGQYRYIVKNKDRSGENFSIYDTRLNRLTEQFELYIDEDEHTYYTRNQRELHSMDYLDNLGAFFVEITESHPYAAIDHKQSKLQEDEQDLDTRYQYLMHFIDTTGAFNGTRRSFQLAAAPFKVLALSNERILVLNGAVLYDGFISTKNFAIYDLKSAEAKKILARNAQKLQAQTALDMKDLIKEN